VQASSVYFKPESFKIGVGQEIQIDLLINTNRKEINAIEGEIILPDNIQLTDINDSKSIISFWVEKPKLNTEKIIFSGVIPNGFRGIINTDSLNRQDGQIISLVVKGKQVSSGEVELDKIRVLLNDGAGSEDVVEIAGAVFEVLEDFVEGVVVDKPTDTTPPEDFPVIFSSDPSIFSGQYFISFNTRDRDSGISFYEVKEGRGEWRVAESPYLLENQSVSRVFVKAVDRAGNQKIVEIETGINNTMRNFITFIVILFVVILLAWILKKFRK
jgi:hypothetical protein